MFYRDQGHTLHTTFVLRKLRQQEAFDMTIDKPTDISETKASGGIKLGSVRYVLVVSLVLATFAGIIIWNVFAR